MSAGASAKCCPDIQGHVEHEKWLYMTPPADVRPISAAFLSAEETSHKAIQINI